MAHFFKKKVIFICSIITVSLSPAHSPSHSLTYSKSHFITLSLGPIQPSSPSTKELNAYLGPFSLMIVIFISEWAITSLFLLGHDQHLTNLIVKNWAPRHIHFIVREPFEP